MTHLITIQLGVYNQLGCFIYCSDSRKIETAENQPFRMAQSSFSHDGIIEISHQFYLIVQQQFFIMIIRFSLHASILNFNFSQYYRISQHLRVFSQHYRNLITAIDVFLIARSTLIYYWIWLLLTRVRQIF